MNSSIPLWIAVVIMGMAVAAAFIAGMRKARDALLAGIEENRKTAIREREQLDRDVAMRPDHELDRHLDVWMREGSDTELRGVEADPPIKK